MSAQDGDCLPLNQFPCVIASIPANSSKTINVIVEINSIGVFDNIASATTVDEDKDSTNNLDDTFNGGITEGLNPDLGLVFNECNNNYSENESVQYEIVVKNFGDVDIPNAAFVSTFSQQIDSVQWSCESFNGASCPSDNGVGNIREGFNLQIGSFLKYTVSGFVSGVLNDVVTVDFSVLLPSSVNDTNINNNNINISQTISDIMFEDGFETITSACD